VPGASGCEYSANYQYVPSVMPYLYISSTSCCNAWPDLCEESKYATTTTVSLQKRQHQPLLKLHAILTYPLLQKKDNYIHGSSMDSEGTST